MVLDEPWVGYTVFTERSEDYMATPETLQSKQKQLNTSSFAKGMYLITITTKNGAVAVKKLMIQ